jgi:hypothetical protein
MTLQDGECDAYYAPCSLSHNNGNGWWLADAYIPARRKASDGWGTRRPDGQCEEKRQQPVRGAAETVWGEKRISPLRCSRQNRERLRSKMTILWSERKEWTTTKGVA